MNAHVIIPTTCDDLEMLFECLRSVFSQCPTARIWVAANGTNCRNLDKLTNIWLDCKQDWTQMTYLHRVDKRLGYTLAVNDSWKQMMRRNELLPFIRPSEDCLCVLNDDTVAVGDFLAPLCASLEGGAAQAGPSLHHVGRDGMWGDGSEPYTFLEGWCWMAKIETIQRAASCIEQLGNVVYDARFNPGYCEDCDLSIRIHKQGGKITEVQNLPILHLRSRTFGNRREPFWTRNREYLVSKWNLAEDAC